MIEDARVTAAVSKILQRSEKQENLERSVQTYVDVGILPQIDNSNNQILYGRRGTGKTHVLRVLMSTLQQRPDTIAVYIDARAMGSSAQYLASDLPLSQRCFALFKDIWGEIYAALEERAARDVESNSRAGDALRELTTLSDTLFTPHKIFSQSSETRTSEVNNSVKSKVEANVSKDGGVQLSRELGSDDKSQTTAQFDVLQEDKVFFPDLHRTLKNVLGALNYQLFILIDEWSSLSQDIQPYLAELLKRSCLPVRHVVLKIAALEYRSKFEIREEHRRVGLEVGADISTGLDLDDHFVFDKNEEGMTSFYADMLFKHISSELPDGYLEQNFGIKNGRSMQSKLFTETATFKEMSRACEGVVRDLINIFTRAYFDSWRKGRPSIDKPSIHEAALSWFEQDKAGHLDAQMEQALEKIRAEVIGNKRARSFLLLRSLERHPIIQKLFDERVLHLMRRGYADKDNAGVRYNIYSLDYGTYVDLLGTGSRRAGGVQLSLFPVEVPNTQSVPIDLVVPFNDNRSIRRVIVSKELLDSISGETN